MGRKIKVGTGMGKEGRGEKKQRRRGGAIKGHGLSIDEKEGRKEWPRIGWGKEEEEEVERRGFLPYLPRGERQGDGYRCTVHKSCGGECGGGCV
jgi:hypothetical protein